MGSARGRRRRLNGEGERKAGLGQIAQKDNRGRSAGAGRLQRGFRHGVDVRSTEAFGADVEGIGADIEAVGVGANQWLVAKAGTWRERATIGGNVQAEDSPIRRGI